MHAFCRVSILGVLTFFFLRFCRFASSPLGVVEGNIQLCMSVGRERATLLLVPLTPLPYKRTQIRNTVESVCELSFGWTVCVVRLISRSNVKDLSCDASPNAFLSGTSTFAFPCDCTVFVALMMIMVATCCVLSLVIAELCLLLCNFGHLLEEKRLLTVG
uniref:Secreted protein n=1 Tax=Ixodes ricinus TaxID=34613 RepID=A0A147BCX6_IXORI